MPGGGCWKFDFIDVLGDLSSFKNFQEQAMLENQEG